MLIAFINATLERVDESPIIDLEYLPTEHLGLDDEHKKVVQDLECRTEDGRQFIVEMQRAIEIDFRDRMAFYAFRSAIDNVLAGERYHLRKVYVIVIMDEILREDSDDFLHMATLRFENSSERLVRYPILLFLEAPKVQPQRHTRNSLIEWFLFSLSKMSQWSQPPVELELFPLLQHLLSAAEFARFTVDEQKVYLKFLDSQRDMKYALEYKHQKGLEQGLEQGLAQGLSQGITQGITQGKAQAQVDAVERMLAKQYSWETIQDLLGVAESDYPSLRKLAGI